MIYEIFKGQITSLKSTETIDGREITVNVIYKNKKGCKIPASVSLNKEIESVEIMPILVTQKIANSIYERIDKNVYVYEDNEGNCKIYSLQVIRIIRVLISQVYNQRISQVDNQRV